MAIKKFTGRCSCGEIHYELKGVPEFSIICQCRNCQRTTGTGHATAFAAAVENTLVNGELSYYKYLSDTGNVVRSGFCARCGNPVLNKPDIAPQLLFIHAATLDDPSVFTPDRVVYSASRQPWDRVDPELPRK